MKEPLLTYWLIKSSVKSLNNKNDKLVKRVSIKNQSNDLGSNPGAEEGIKIQTSHTILFVMELRQLLVGEEGAINLS